VFAAKIIKQNPTSSLRQRCTKFSTKIIASLKVLLVLGFAWIG
jgi:hypothetical protein